MSAPAGVEVEPDGRTATCRDGRGGLLRVSVLASGTVEVVASDGRTSGVAITLDGGAFGFLFGAVFAALTRS